ncbi:MAG: ABC transporter substrate-binding protein [Euryarchaeota archaeon]|nr:ABC transporter substrate-binding protein [Euryarchaeota archaeon]MCG2736066.1 ABC transporter substrate-binding protein [Candidatus Methanoperedenaceae archaeon]
MRINNNILFIVLIFISILIMGCLNEDIDKSDQVNKGITNGITDSEIIIGSSSALTGHTGFLGTQYIRGSLAYINEINANGGVHGRKIKLISYDDQYDPVKTVSNTQKLIFEDKVFILFDYVGTPTSIRIINIVQEAKIPVLGLFTGAEELRTPFRPYIFNVRASYYQETDAAVDYFVEKLDFKKIAVFYQDDAFGMSGLKGVEIALNKYGMMPIATGTYVRGSEDVENALVTIRNANPEAIVMIGTYTPLAKFVKLYKEQGYNPYFHSVSFVGADAFALELSSKGIRTHDKIIVTQVVPDPYETSATYLQTVKDYREHTAKYFPEDMPNYVGLEGYVNAKVLVRALNEAGRDLNRDKFIEAIESMNNYSIGIGIPVKYGHDDHQAFDRVYFSRLDNGGFPLFEID